MAHLEYINLWDKNKINKFMKLPKSTIDEFKEYLDLPYEVCGALHSNGIPYKYVIKGPKIAHNQRGSCIMPRSAHVWHTHPKHSKPVPSIEDVIRAINKNDRKTSIIVTTLGIYTLINKNYNKPKYYNNENKLNPEICKHITKYITNEINDILRLFKSHSSIKVTNNAKRIVIKESLKKLNIYLKHFISIKLLDFEH